ncbi:hypothetical protein Patl1_32823 [Pistacia atlantica]|uniref:Uncharacterized protein n=1 Tax=Pistacia atlantica TaxID=434234 RepID=A0ACC1APY4_9ROSI|nr:hypothetical protein Patl1_32823 [Pistacia atlantica]
MAFSRTPLISFLLISLLFASSMARPPPPAPPPTSLPPSASKTRPGRACLLRRLHRVLLLLSCITACPSPLPSISSPPALLPRRSPSHRLKLLLQRTLPFLMICQSWIFGGWVVLAVLIM